ncbi:MAG: PQQ-dependent sugar dehydrogenase [Armatimonadetes bacterium]|nr:PQQ-dependent sugar dehydrogenase [Armatimonadota bacterium]
MEPVTPNLIRGPRLRSAGLIVASAAITLLICSASLAAITKGPQMVELQAIATGLTAPIALAHTSDSRLFIVDQTGKVLIYQNGGVLPTPFLDVSSKITPLTPGYDERGLLGMAFHPNNAANGKFYVHYTAPTATTNWDHKNVVSEFTVSGNPSIANAASERVLLTFDHPQSNHNGGTIAFGADGKLYIASGDGGNANDEDPAGSPIVGHTPSTGNAQDLTKLLGKILRIDVDSMDAGMQYHIPADNPFVGNPSAQKEIYAYGFRNPYSFSFDRGGTHRLFAGDVGQNTVEEVDIVTSGGNYGWKAKEGTHVFDPLLPQTGYVDPIAEYLHSDGGTATIGGYVYRGTAIPSLAGKYVFGELSRDFNDFPTGKGRLFYLNESTPGVFSMFEMKIGPNDRPLGPVYIKGFGEDNGGELYILTTGEIGPQGTSGQILKLAPSTVGVEISSFAFNPATVKILPGDSVTWTNRDAFAHTTTSGTGTPPVADGIWNSGSLGLNASFTRVFPTSGTFPYFCSFHTTMRGTVLVASPISPTAAAALGDGSSAALQGVVVTGIFPGGFWVESTDRLGGIYVASSFIPVMSQGLDIIGSITTVNGRKTLNAEVIRPTDKVTSAIKPIGFVNKFLGVAPNNPGILVRVWGMATADQGTDYFTISDGSPGVVVKIQSGSLIKPLPNTGQVFVNGIESSEGVPAQLVVIPRSQADIEGP